MSDDQKKAPPSSLEPLPEVDGFGKPTGDHRAGEAGE